MCILKTLYYTEQRNGQVPSERNENLQAVEIKFLRGILA